MKNYEKDLQSRIRNKNLRKEKEWEETKRRLEDRMTNDMIIAIDKKIGEQANEEATATHKEVVDIIKETQQQS